MNSDIELLRCARRTRQDGAATLGELRWVYLLHRVHWDGPGGPQVVSIVLGELGEEG